MSDFAIKYLELLRRQVQEEISYLCDNGHDTDEIPSPCTFCIEEPPGHICHRLLDLRQFLAVIGIQRSHAVLVARTQESDTITTSTTE